MSKRAFIAQLCLIVLGGAAGYWLALQRQTAPLETETAVLEQPLFYRNPMNPEITSPVPAKDDMGMDYIPVYAGGAQKTGEVPGTVQIDAVTEQNIGVRTAVAKRETLSHIVRAVGRVAYDEEHLLRLHPKTEGWIEVLNIDKTGQWVKKDEDLLSIYSPQLVASQQEYILALNSREALKNSPIEDIRRGADELVKSSLERLKLLDVPAHQLHDLTHHQAIKKSLHIHSPQAGIVMNIGVREGQYVTPATELYMIADLSKVWVYADIYEYELPWIKAGDRVEMRLAGIPGSTFKGHLAYIYPYAEAKTRTIKVRLAFDNPDLLLKPNMFADVTIQVNVQPNMLAIPSEAVIRSGPRNQVFVERAAGKFEPRTVILGLNSDGKVAVLEGITEGERVVTSSQFLLDSESKLREVAAKMIEPKQRDSDMPMDHSGHDMNMPGVHQHD